MHSHPFSQVGYDIRNLEDKINRKADQYEIHALRSSVDSLEHSLREARAETDGLRYRVETLEESIRLIGQALEGRDNNGERSGIEPLTPSV